MLQPVGLVRLQYRILRLRLPEPVRLLPRARERGRGVCRDQGPLRPDAAPPRRRGVPQPLVLHLRRLRRRGRRVPVLRRDGRRQRAQAGGRRVPGADFPGDLRRLVLVGVLPQGGEGCLVVGLLRTERAVAVRSGQDVPPARTHADRLQLQLRPDRPGHRRGPAEQPGAGRDRPDRCVQDRAVALDDPTVGEAAVLSHRCHRAVESDSLRRVGRPGARLRAVHERPHRRPHQPVQTLLQHPRRQLRAQPTGHRLLQPGAVQWDHQLIGAVVDVLSCCVQCSVPLIKTTPTHWMSRPLLLVMCGGWVSVRTVGRVICMDLCESPAPVCVEVSAMNKDERLSVRSCEVIPMCFTCCRDGSNCRLD